MSLKHYERYKRLLHNFATACRLKVRYTSTQDDAFVPGRNTIRLEKGQEEAEEIATMLHEIGHFLQFLTISDAMTDKVERAYGTYYKNSKHKPSRRVVIGFEQQAWKYGESLAMQLKIDLGTWYYKIADDCIKSYRE